MEGNILVVDDDTSAAEVLVSSLHARGHVAEHLSSGRVCLERARSGGVDIVIAEAMLKEMSGIDLVRELRDLHPEILPIVMTGWAGTDVAIAAMRAGAYDYIRKPISDGALEVSLSRALGHLALQHELERLQHVTEDDFVASVVGTSPEIRRTLELVRRVAPTDATVLITGESGTGKERIAHAVHQMSNRRNEPFIAINCGAMPVPLLESELFGHVRGAFTDAVEGRVGVFLRAARGTILLDEVGDMPLEMQVKLLRVLQARSVRPIGGAKELPSFARVIAATNRRLEEEVAAKRFREDLFHRINVVPIDVPALRNRHDDILPLAHTILRRCAARRGRPVRGITPQAARILLDYNWPGNVRELENCIERAVALCRLDQITIDDLPLKLRAARSSPIIVPDCEPGELITLGQLRQRYVRKVLAAAGGNKTAAARILGIDRRTITTATRVEAEPHRDCK
jgi:two-component system, NtrC family, response regulator HydG